MPFSSLFWFHYWQLPSFGSVLPFIGSSVHPLQAAVFSAKAPITTWCYDPSNKMPHWQLATSPNTLVYFSDISEKLKRIKGPELLFVRSTDRVSAGCVKLKHSSYLLYEALTGCSSCVKFCLSYREKKLMTAAFMLHLQCWKIGKSRTNTYSDVGVFTHHSKVVSPSVNLVKSIDINKDGQVEGWCKQLFPLCCSWLRFKWYPMLWCEGGIKKRPTVYWI